MNKLGTKAQNLEVLAREKINAYVLDTYVINYAVWKKNEEGCLENIRRRFSGNVIVRSCAKGEDTIGSQTAGKYNSVLDVPLEYHFLKQAIESVFASYEECFDDNEILIQPYLGNTRKSGVIFTYDVNRNLPYYVIELSDSSDTSAVTGGNSNAYKTYWIAKGALLFNEFGMIVDVVKRIEEIFQCSFLDIEFAIDSEGNLVIFQVRQLFCAHKKTYGNIVLHGLNEIALQQLRFDCRYAGNLTLFSNMTDWNPAELVGRHPYPLDYSLYNLTFTQDSWLIGREKIGYKNNYISSLTRLINGFAYVDVQKDFNSYLPKGLSPLIESKLVNMYLNELSVRGELFDKAEFEIVDTCYTVSTSREKYYGVLSNEECDLFFECLKRMTNSIILDSEGVLRECIDKFERQKRQFTQNQDLKYNVELLREYGALYSSIVRAAFISYEELLALTEKKLVSVDERDSMMSSIKSITSQQLDDIEKYQGGHISKNELKSKYRHIREDMFNILSKSKYEMDDYYDNLHSSYRATRCYTKTVIKRKSDANKQMQELGLLFTIDDLITSIQKMFEYREQIKYEIGRVLTEVYKNIIDVALIYEIPPEDMRYATIDDIIVGRLDLKRKIYLSKREWDMQEKCILPDLIKTRNDLFMVKKQEGTPNYITNRTIEADVLCLDNYEGPLSELEGRIVLINRADPGFDWIFGMGIVGVVTCYGGVASHMSIRAYEIGIPAIVGCGKMVYNEIKQSKRMIIDCAKSTYKRVS